MDTGLVPEMLTTPRELAALAGARAHEVVRLERVAEDLLESSVPPARRRRAAPQPTLVVGGRRRQVHRGLPGRSRAPGVEADRGRAGQRTDAGAARSRWLVRIARPDRAPFLAWTALDLGLPLQFHVGYGDSDLNLGDCDPLLLTPFLRATQAVVFR